MGKLQPGVNDLETWCKKNGREELLQEWDYENNEGLTPKDVCYGSHKLVWWKCKEGHRYKKDIDSRHSGVGCPKCSGINFVHQDNLFKVHPKLIQELNLDKNSFESVQNLSCGSNKKIYWKCKTCNGEWIAAAGSRANGVGCPYCSNKKVLPGYNDLATVEPELAKEWHPTKNGNFTPNDVTSGSEKKVWWICEEGHEWRAAVKDRKKGSGCPFCKKELKTSFPEQAIYFYIKKIFPDAINSGNDVIGAELDIYIPSIKTAIEYDGVYYHKRNDFEKNKNTLCKNKNITLIRIREEGLTIYDDCCCILRTPASGTKSLNIAIIKLLNIIAPHIASDIDVKRDENAILQTYISNKKKNSLLICSPELAKEWHSTKNGCLTPEMVTKSSGKVVWWLGKCGHEWQTKINGRANGTGCPYCSGESVLPGFNDLATVNPELAKEWHPTKNGDLTPTMIMTGSGKKVWWKCSKGHEWQSTVTNRVKGTGCPYCSGNKVLAGYNDFQTKFPELAKEWHPTRNGDLKPCDVAPCSSKEVWWLGDCGHEWKQRIVNRTTHKKSCPICSGRKVFAGYNDLATTNPELTKQWHPTKNVGLSPKNISAGSNRRVWWICPNGHEWKAAVCTRAKGVGCPICSNIIVLKGFNDLATTNPKLSKEWDYKKNSNLTPQEVAGGSEKKAWWLCPTCGHSWKAAIHSRNTGTGCPKCAIVESHKRQSAIAATKNNLFKNHPDIANQWHPTKNGSLLPNMVSSSSNRKVWWLGECGHEWQATIDSRTRGTGCPYCCNQKHKKIICVETGKLYNTFADAAKFCNLSAGSYISACCRGKQKTAGGYHWKFYEEEGE